MSVCSGRRCTPVAEPLSQPLLRNSSLWAVLPQKGAERPATGERARGFGKGTYGVPSSDRWRSVTCAGGAGTIRRHHGGSPTGSRPDGGDDEVTRTPIRRVRALGARQQHGTYAFLPPPGGLDHS